jgi:hypothetical protein
MAISLLSGQTATTRSPQFATKGSSSATIRSGDFFYFSDNPESVSSSALADNGKYLNWAEVTGNGQVYIWHHNTSGSQINTLLSIYNPNSYAVKVSATNYGTTKYSSVTSDAAAWSSFMSGNSTSTVIAANSWGSLFAQSIPNNYV